MQLNKSSSFLVLQHLLIKGKIKKIREDTGLRFGVRSHLPLPPSPSTIIPVFQCILNPLRASCWQVTAQWIGPLASSQISWGGVEVYTEARGRVEEASPNPGLMVWSEPLHSHCSTSIKSTDREAEVEPCSQFHSAKLVQACRVWAWRNFQNTHSFTRDCHLLSSPL